MKNWFDDFISRPYIDIEGIDHDPKVQTKQLLGFGLNYEFSVWDYLTAKKGYLKCLV